MEVPLKIDARKEPPCLVVHVQGRLDAISAPLFERDVSARLDATIKRLIFEFSGVEYLSSAGIRTLISFAKKMKAAQGAIFLCSLIDSVEETIVVSNLNNVLNIVKSVEDAKKAK